MVDGYIPKGLWSCGSKLRNWVKQHNGGEVPDEVEAWIVHFEELAVAANDLERARTDYEATSRALSRFGKEVSAKVLRKIDRDRAQVQVQHLKLHRHLKARGPAQ